MRSFELNLIEPILSPGATVELNRFTTQLTPLLEQLMNQTREFPALVPGPIQCSDASPPGGRWRPRVSNKA